jgi:hypothetical protein
LSIHPRYQAKVKALFEAKGKMTGLSSEAFLGESMKALALKIGFGPTLLVTHDPTDPTIWCLLARRTTDSEEDLPYARLLSVTVVEEPPTQTRSPMLGLDAGLTEAEVWAVQHALSKDEDTKHLGGFASTLDPDFPIASNLLKAKAMLAAIRSYRGPIISPGDKSKDLSSLVTVLQKATSSLGEDVIRAWDKYRNIKAREKDEKMLGEVVSALTAAFISRKTRTLPTAPSPAALQLAYATRRPKLSLVEDDGQITRRLSEIARGAKAGEPDAKKAQAKLEDANRTMERLQWVEWYKRHIQVQNNDDPAPGSVTGGWVKDRPQAWSSGLSKSRMNSR